MLLLFILVIVAVSAVMRLVAFPFRVGRRFPPFFGYRNYGGYGNPYGYGYGHRRHHGIGHVILVVLALLALSHLFGHHHHHRFL
jgi:hypothetical protein